MGAVTGNEPSAQAQTGAAGCDRTANAAAHWTIQGGRREGERMRVRQ